MQLNQPLVMALLIKKTNYQKVESLWMSLTEGLHWKVSRAEAVRISLTLTHKAWALEKVVQACLQNGVQVNLCLHRRNNLLFLAVSLCRSVKQAELKSAFKKYLIKMSSWSWRALIKMFEMRQSFRNELKDSQKSLRRSISRTSLMTWSVLCLRKVQEHSKWSVASADSKQRTWWTQIQWQTLEMPLVKTTLMSYSWQTKQGNLDLKIQQL